MPLRDPELELLRELVAEDPTDPVFRQVGEELIRRQEWKEAARVLRAGLAGAPYPQGWVLLARAALEINEPDAALAAIRRALPALQQDAEVRRIHLLALEQVGRYEEARRAAETLVEDAPEDPVALTALERLAAPPPDVSRRGRDPYLTVARAEGYASVGRHDRALRAYRRILRAWPNDTSLRNRLAQLEQNQEAGLDVDDLSEELPDPAAVPPELPVPAPRLVEAAPPALLRALPPLEATPLPPPTFVASPKSLPPAGLVELEIGDLLLDVDGPTQ